MAVNDIWAPVVAALGASSLTALTAFGLDAHKAKRAKRESLGRSRVKAYSELLSQAGLIAHTAGALHATMQARSGLSEGLSVTLGMKAPLDALELDEVLRRDTEHLYTAWSAVWTIGTSEAVPLANTLVDRCAAVIGAATQRGEAGTKLARLLSGESWTPEQLDQWAHELQALAAARRDLADCARREVGVEVAALLAASVP